MTLSDYIKKMNDYCPHCGGSMELGECDCDNPTQNEETEQS